MFIESICNDEAVLEANYRAKMRYSPDYSGMPPENALSDFKRRIQKYLDVYETIDDRRLHYIKVVDMVTGRGYMDVNRISGERGGDMLVFVVLFLFLFVSRRRRCLLSRAAAAKRSRKNQTQNPTNPNKQ
jgi:6-phosphofructo-2-kinase / fructose-2,6-biphosphatase 3